MSVLHRIPGASTLFGSDDRPGRTDQRTGLHIADTYYHRFGSEYAGRGDDNVWLYRVLDNVPLRYEDEARLLDHGRKVTGLLSELGSLSIPKPSGLMEPPAGFYRQIHVLSVRWYERPAAPPGTPTKALADMLNREVLNFTAPSQRTFIGIQLRDLEATAKRRNATWMDVARERISRALHDDSVDMDRYQADRDRVHQMLARGGCRVPDREERRQLEAWFNHGSHNKPELAVPKDPPVDYLLVDRRDRLEFSVLEEFNTPAMEPPWQEWLADTLDHSDGPAVVSLRAELQPPSDTRKAMRRSMRVRRLNEQERMAAGQDDHAEEAQDEQLTRFAEARLAVGTGDATLRNTSVIFGYRSDGATQTETYADFLRSRYGIEVTPLAHYQLEALEHTMPCSQRRLNPYPKALSLDHIGYAGLGMFTNVGDDDGAMIGRGLPDGIPVYFDPFAAPRANQSPAVLVSGVPGSGKTHLSLNISFQTALAGKPVVFINPKGFDSLLPVAEMMQSRGVDVEWVAISQLTKSGGEGSYDPFRYAQEPETAASIAANLITTVLTEFDQRQRNSLRHGLSIGAKNGAGCVGEALRYVDEDARAEVMHLAESTPLFALSIGQVPKPRLEQDPLTYQQRGKFMLIEFDVDLNLPSEVKERGYTDAERIGLSAIRSVTTASVGMLASMQGGLMVMDEAHNVLGHPETISLISKTMREARSLNVAQIYATQLVSDLLSVGGTGSSLESYISSVFALRMVDEKECAAALKLVGYEPTPEYMAWMRDFGPKRTEAGQQPAYGFYRDMKGRRTLLSFGPTSPQFAAAASTNIDDKTARARARESGMAADVSQPVA